MMGGGAMVGGAATGKEFAACFSMSPISSSRGLFSFNSSGWRVSFLGNKVWSNVLNAFLMGEKMTRQALAIGFQKKLKQAMTMFMTISKCRSGRQRTITAHRRQGKEVPIQMAHCTAVRALTPIAAPPTKIIMICPPIIIALIPRKK